MNPTVGQALNCSTGTWANSPTSYSFQWQQTDAAGGSQVDIPGATTSSYTVQAGDTGLALVCVVTAVNIYGATPVSSVPTGLVGGGGGGVTSALPPAGGYFPLTSSGDFPVPAGGLARLLSLPNDAAAAAMVHRSTWEPRPENVAANNTIPPVGALNLGPAMFANSVWARVTGRCPLSNPTTDELIQWAAAKWGLSDELIRAEMVQESHWYQGLKWSNSMPPAVLSQMGLSGRPVTSPLGSPVFGHGYGDYAPLQNGNIDQSTGEYYGAPGVAPGIHYSIPRSWMPGVYDGTLVDAHLNGSNLEDRDLGAESYGMSQCKWHVWRKVNPGMGDLGAYPWIETSTATALDLYACAVRAEYEGLNTFPQGSAYASYKASPGGSVGVWGAVGFWFSGAWYGGGAPGYIAKVQGYLSSKPWLVAGF